VFFYEKIKDIHESHYSWEIGGYFVGTIEIAGVGQVGEEVDIGREDNYYKGRS